MKAIYFGDPMDNIQEEGKRIQETCKEGGDLEFHPFIITDTPPFKEIYDVLFFDWGGMSLGNSLMESFCRQIVGIAESNPNRCFVMVSQFTKAAMEDTIRELPDRPFNIYLTIEDFISEVNNDSSNKE